MLAVTLYFLLEVSGQPFSSVLVLAFIFYRLMQHVNTLQGMMQSVVVGESAFWSLWEQISEAEAAEVKAAPAEEKSTRDAGESRRPVEQPWRRSPDNRQSFQRFLTPRRRSGS